MKLAVISCLLLKITFSETWEEMSRHLQLGSIWKLVSVGPPTSITDTNRGGAPLGLCYLLSEGSLDLNKEEQPQSLEKFEKNCPFRKPD